MAGTLTISTLSDGTNSTSSTNCIQGSAKAWVRFNSSSASSAVIAASYNVSSVTYVGVGIFTVNFTNALADANYVYSGACSFNDAVSSPVNPTIFGYRQTAPTASALSLTCCYVNTTNVYANAGIINVSIFR